MGKHRNAPPASSQSSPPGCQIESSKLSGENSCGPRPAAISSGPGAGASAKPGSVLGRLEEHGGKQPFPHTIWPSSGHRHLLPLQEQMPLSSTCICIQGVRLLGGLQNGAGTPHTHPGGCIWWGCHTGVGTVQGHPRRSPQASSARPGTHDQRCSSAKHLGMVSSSIWTWCFLLGSAGTQ